MPSKREVLDQLKRDELLAAVDQAGLEVRDRRVRDELAEAEPLRLPRGLKSQ